MNLWKDLHQVFQKIPLKSTMKHLNKVKLPLLQNRGNEDNVKAKINNFTSWLVRKHIHTSKQLL